MKLNKIFKKISLKTILIFGFLVFFLLFLYLGYYYYAKYQDYKDLKNNKSQIGKDGSVVNVPLSTFKFKDLSKNIFSLERGKVKAAAQPVKKTNFMVVGVVQKNDLFVVIKFNNQKKFELFKEKAKINKNCVVKSINLEKVVIREYNKDKTYKIFKFIPNIL